MQALSDEDKVKLQGLYKVCVDETKVEEGLIKKMRAGEFPEDEPLKKYVYCMFKKIGFLDEKDEIVVEKVKAKSANTAESDKVIENCKDTKADNPAGLAYNLYKCYHQSVEEVIQF